MVFEDFFFYATQGGMDGADLRENVDAVTAIVDHADNASHLPLNTFEFRDYGFLYF
jgi:hypothetical protein